MQRRKKRTPRDELAQYGLRLLDDAENSKNSALIELRTEFVAKYFDAHLKATAAVSPRVALCVTTPVLLLLAAITIYSAMKQSRSVFVSVAVSCIMFAIIFAVAMLGLSGKMEDTVVSKVMLGIVQKIWPSLLGTPDHSAEGEDGG